MPYQGFILTEEIVSKKHRWFIWVIVIIIIVGIGLLAYVYIAGLNMDSESTPVVSTPQKSDDTADWENWRNEYYGYEIKYPSDWDVITTTNDINQSGIIFSSSDKEVKEISASGPYIVKGVEVTVQCNDDLILREMPEWADRFFSEEQITIGGVETTKSVYDNLLDKDYGMVIDILFNKGNNWYIITCYPAGPKQQDYIETFNQMLSTFEFIN